MASRLAGLVAGWVLAAPGAVLADGTVTGRARFERIQGRPAMGHVELYESNLFLSPDGGGPLGPSFRLGAPPGQAPRGDGFYALSVPAGTWSALVSQPLFFTAPKVVPGVTVVDGRTTVAHIELPIDYSTYFTDSWTPWGEVWIQTFAATGRSISGVSWRLAGTDAGDIEASVHRSDGTADPSGWPLVSSRAVKRDSVAVLADNWVRWLTGDVPATPGETYAVKLTGLGGGFAVFKRDKDASSYAQGRAHDREGRPQGFDLNVTVFSENDGAAVLYRKTTEGIGELRDGFFGGLWGQSFRATAGTSLAAVDVWAAGADRRWDLDFTFRVREDGPQGLQVGPAKTTKAAFQAFGAGLHGVSYAPGEVPLEPGRTYLVEFTNPEGFNPYVMTDPADAYAAGDAWQSGTRRAGVDLSMTVIVYKGGGGTVSGRITDAASGRALDGVAVTLVELGRSARSGADGRYELRDVPAGAYTLEAARSGFETARRPGVDVAEGEAVEVDLALRAEACAESFDNPGFEGGLAGWTRYGDARSDTVDTSGGGWFGDITAIEGARFHGNAINGCCLSGGLHQRVCATPGRRYRVSAWSNIYWISGTQSVAVSRLGVDLQGGSDPTSGAIVWSALHRQPREAIAGWTELELEVEATGPVMTVFLDFRQSAASGNMWRINCFDGVDVTELGGAVFRRGDCDGSAGEDITDAIFLLDHLFRGGRMPGCIDACDLNDDGGADLSDAVYLLRYLFTGGAAPPAPGTACGEDPTADALECASGC